TNDAALAGDKGVDGSIDILPGDRIPLIPRHIVKANASVSVTRKLTSDVIMTAVSGSNARGNENNAHQPGGEYSRGPGLSAAYVPFHVPGRYPLLRPLP